MIFFRRFLLLVVTTLCLSAISSLYVSASEEQVLILPLSPLTILSSGGVSHRFDVEVADTQDLRAQGLMYRREMAEGHGMLFLFDTNRMVTMWMKNTYIPLDILFIDSTGAIVHIAHDTVPESLAHISSTVPVISALELNAGTAQRLKIEVGDKIEHTYFPNN